jgi:hypothetical protein
MNTQNARLLEYLRTHAGITQFEAIAELGILRLASRISELKRAGHHIFGEMVSVKNRFDEIVKVKRYFLVENA